MSPPSTHPVATLIIIVEKREEEKEEEEEIKRVTVLKLSSLHKVIGKGFL